MEHSTATVHLVKGLKSLLKTLEGQNDSVDAKPSGAERSDTTPSANRFGCSTPKPTPASTAVLGCVNEDRVNKGCVDKGCVDKDSEAHCNVASPDFSSTENRVHLLNREGDRSTYCGIDLQTLCDDGCFESVMWLLLHREQANPEQLADTAARLLDATVIDRPLADTISTIPLQVRPLDLFPLSISLLSCFDSAADDVSAAGSRSQFWNLMAELPTLMHVALGGSIEDGRPVFSCECSDPEISAQLDEPNASWAGRLLRILRTDNRPVTATEEHAMNVFMTCECITGDRPADRMAASMGAAVTDIVAAWKAASAVFVSQLKNDPFLWTAKVMSGFENPVDAQQWWQDRKGRPIPFGFSGQPESDRSAILGQQCQELLGSVPALVMEASCRRLEAVRAADGRFPTTDWTATRLLLLLGVPEDRISVAIGMARLVGWAAHHLDRCEQGATK